jgi:TolB-like protein
MTPASDDVRRQLDRLLASALFANAGRMSRFLKFVVERTLAGDGERLKEYVIGVEVFDRDADYDPRLDAIVRVEAARLRSKLAEYYATEGRGDAVVLTMPKGGYAPEIRFDDRTAASASSAAVSPPPRTRRVGGWLLGAALVAAAASAVVAWQPWGPVAGGKLRVAVMPLTPYPDATAATEAVAMRVTEGVTAELVRDGRFAVVASSAARAAYTPGVRPRDVAAALDAAVLVEGRVMTNGDRIRVEVRASGRLEQKFWADGFAGSAADSDALEREVAAAIGTALAAVPGQD